MNTSILRWIFSALVAVFLLACHDDEEERPPVRTIIVYLAGDNNLSSYMNKNVADMMRGMKRRDCRLVVYSDGSTTAPELFEIVPSGRDTAVKVPVASYPEENSASPETLRRVIEEVKALFPAPSYGLILGSHATGWVPANAKITTSGIGERLEQERPLTRTFGQDVSSASAEMDIQEMAAAIPEGFDFIFFDACMMSSIEVLYELRAKTRYVIAAAAEIDARGFPYANILPFLWGDVHELQKACEYFYNLYESFATITLVDATGLEGLFTIARQVFQGKADAVAAIPATAIAGEIFKYPRINIPNDIYFDLREFVKYMATDAQLLQFDQQLKRVVIYHDITDPFYTTPVPDKSRACGISTYIPRAAWSAWNTGYFTFAWAGIYQ